MASRASRSNDRRHRTKQLRRIYQRDNGICQLCGEPCTVADASREHVFRLADGGTGDDTNVVLAHKRCNQDADTNPDYYLRSYSSQSPDYQDPHHAALWDQLLRDAVTDSDTQK